ncbi:class I SAM-dependent methyltransferase [Anaerobacillus isosaccharinicus]|uniref:Methyltransferase domain-containing protein n=1 Tax=Anaerobacillus isosaccharinicus TaxID=1532552 RepID=A0A1S2M8S0_9BACI|nr:methyltransferase domain-containing protein [Anaerobacillus isosaccharinicus]MBA5587617.1 methyltransferase domain-containing protein [Anaerobacillus isosaccharinicus]QOY34207.1 methyltransferase domain-containing protein [Anaerobacillus isosaccharinicus]
MEKKEVFYETVYKSGGSRAIYHKHYSKSIYLPIWEKALRTILEKGNPFILEVGCGPGQFANLLFDHGLENYRGFDFSSTAIKLAKQTNAKYQTRFSVDNAYTTSLFTKLPYNTAVLFEVLEHLQEDLKVLNDLINGTMILFSVPNFNSQSHVRYFLTQDEVRKRYEKIIDIDEIHTFPISSKNKIFLVIGTKRPVS